MFWYAWLILIFYSRIVKDSFTKRKKTKLDCHSYKISSTNCILFQTSALTDPVYFTAIKTNWWGPSNSWKYSEYFTYIWKVLSISIFKLEPNNMLNGILTRGWCRRRSEKLYFTNFKNFSYYSCNKNIIFVYSYIILAKKMVRVLLSCCWFNKKWELYRYKAKILWEFLYKLAKAWNINIGWQPQRTFKFRCSFAEINSTDPRVRTFGDDKVISAFPFTIIKILPMALGIKVYDALPGGIWNRANVIWYKFSKQAVKKSITVDVNNSGEVIEHVNLKNNNYQYICNGIFQTNNLLSKIKCADCNATSLKFNLNFKPEPVSPLTRISLNVQTKVQLKISRIRNQSNPQNTKNTTKFGPKSPHLNRTLENKPSEKQTKKRRRDFTFGK